jgi:hypothetical protein
MSDRLGRLLAELPVPASAEARERTVAGARHALPPRRRPRRRPVAASAACVLALALASPPGQAAIERVGELVGIGDVGEAPTLGPPTGVIVDNGRAPDGTGYEWNAYPGGVGGSESCIRLDWPARPDATKSVACSAYPDSSRSPWGRNYLSSFEVRRLEPGDVMLTGVTTREPHSMRILHDGRDLEVDFARVEGERLERVNAPAPFGVFTAFVPADAAAPLDRYRNLGLIGPRLPGPEPTPDSSEPPECRYEAPPGPFEYRFYDGDGKLLARVPTLVGRIAPAGCRP